MAEIVSIELAGRAADQQKEGFTGDPKWSNNSPQRQDGFVSRRLSCRIQVLDGAVACTF